MTIEQITAMTLEEFETWVKEATLDELEEAHNALCDAMDEVGKIVDGIDEDSLHEDDINEFLSAYSSKIKKVEDFNERISFILSYKSIVSVELFGRISEGCQEVVDQISGC